MRRGWVVSLPRLRQTLALAAYVGGQRMAALNLEDALKAAREAAEPSGGLH